MGRQAAFDGNEVLEKATQVFLRNGFRYTTIKDITEATGLQSGSIYSAFENKTGFYTEVIQYYTQKQIEILEACSKNSDTHLDAIKSFLITTSKNISDRTPYAHSLLVHGVFELSKSEKELRYYLQLKIHEIESRFYVLLVKAQGNNELTCNEDPIELARFLMTLYFGNCVLVQLNSSSKTVSDMIERLFKVLEFNG